MSTIRPTLPIPTGAPPKEWLERAALGMAEAYIVNVTPAMAEVWLKQNVVGEHGNRRFRKAHARSLAEEMRRGEWKVTHQGIAFGRSGRLLDGQHRLAAIVDSGTTQPLLVFIDAPEDGFANFDRGAQRGMSDVLLKNPVLVSIAATLTRLCVRSGGNSARKATPAEVAKVLETLAPDIEAQNVASPALRVGRTLAGIRGAWLVRHHVANDAEKKLLAAQWKAFAEFDPKRMDETTASGDRRLEHTRAMRGGAVDNEVAAIGWLMFDPARRDLTRILLRNIQVPLDDLRAMIRKFIPELAVTEIAGAKVREEKVKRAMGWTPMADPELGPILRAKAIAAIAAKRKGA